MVWLTFARAMRAAWLLLWMVFMKTSIDWFRTEKSAQSCRWKIPESIGGNPTSRYKESQET